MNNLIYISGPITNGGTATPKQAHDNVRRAMQVYGKLIEKGYSPVLPHFSYFYWLDHEGPQRTHDDWIETDFHYIEACDFFFYMEPEIYGEAKGAKQELEFAEKQQKIIFHDFDTVPEYPPTFRTLRVGDA